MRGDGSVLGSVLELVPWEEFERLVERHGSDVDARRFTTRHHLIALIYGQLSGAQSLRELEVTLASHDEVLRRIGGGVVRRSTLADANQCRSASVFCALFEHLLGMAGGGLRRKLGGAVRLIDSSGLPLAGLGTQWARFSKGVCGAKVHVVYDPDEGRPLYQAISPARVNDITAAKAMPIEAGATYVFDLGYYDYGWWAALDQAGCRLVTRFKTNTPLHRACEKAVEPGSGVVSDRIGFLPARLAASRRNPMCEAVREVVVTTETGKRLRLLSNDLDAPAKEIADLYRTRWQIELFFRLMKQTLRITRFLGRSQNAIRIQIAVALVTYLLLRLLQARTQGKHGWLELVRLIRANLMHQKNIENLLKPRPSLRRCRKKLSIAWS